MFVFQKHKNVFFLYDFQLSFFFLFPNALMEDILASNLFWKSIESTAKPPERAQSCLKKYRIYSSGPLLPIFALFILMPAMN